jgi:hypothetical protein
VSDPGSSTRLCFFLEHVYNGYGDRNISVLSSYCIFFSFFFCSHSRKGRSQFDFSTCYDGNCLLLRNTCSTVSTPNILARKSVGVLLQYCKIGAKSKGNNRPGPLVSVIENTAYGSWFSFRHQAKGGQKT